MKPAGGRKGRPYGDEGKGMPGPAGRAAARAAPTGAKERGCRVRRAGLGPAPTGEAEHRASGGHVPPTVSNFRFPFFVEVDMHRSHTEFPLFVGGHEPLPTPDSRFS